MGRRLFLVNVLVLIGIVVLARHVTNAWHGFEETHNVPAALGNLGKVTPKEVSVEVPPLPVRPEAFPNYTVIAEKDLFMPDRRPAPVEQQVMEKAPPMPKSPSLNGVLNNGGKKQALVTIFEGNNPKGSSRMVSIGDDIQGWTVSEIADTTMKIRWKEEEKLIDMFDSTPQQQAAVPARTSAVVTVITIGSAAAVVETSESSEAPPAQRAGGLEVGVTGAPGVVGQRGPGQVQGGRGNMGGESMRGGIGGAGTAGFPSSGSNSVPFTSGTRRRPTGR